MIDFHYHALPYVDDGSKNYDMSINMLKESFKEGIQVICATPHYISMEHCIERNAYDEKLASLKQLCITYKIDIDIFPGMEIYLDPELPALYREKKIWGLNDSPYLLIEFPMEHYPMYSEGVFYELMLQGAIPVIAHPERNLKFMKNKTLLVNLIDKGALLQLNTGSLEGFYGRAVKEFAKDLVQCNMIHLLGSDAHNDTTRTPKFNNGLNILKGLNKELYEWIKEEQYKIVLGKPVETLPVRNAKKSFWFFKK